jgi:hypothetical protein
MVGEAEGQDTGREEQAEVKPYRPAQADEFRGAKEALDPNESQVG